MAKRLSKKSKKLVEKGLKDAKAGRIVSYPIQIDFFNDARKNILIRTTPWTHPKNPEMIKPYEQKTLYVQAGFLKLWDQGGYFQLLVE